jgi:hypothetical protein
MRSLIASPAGCELSLEINMTNKDPGAMPATDADLDVVLGIEPLLQAALALRVAINAAERERLNCDRAMTPDSLHRHWAASQACVRDAAAALHRQIDAFVATALAAASELQKHGSGRRTT